MDGNEDHDGLGIAPARPNTPPVTARGYIGSIDNASLGTMLVAIPVIHLICTSIFLWSYCSGFGANLTAFVTYQDVFATSILSITKLYAIAVVGPVLSGIRNFFLDAEINRADVSPKTFSVVYLLPGLIGVIAIFIAIHRRYFLEQNIGHNLVFVIVLAFIMYPTLGLMRGFKITRARDAYWIIVPVALVLTAIFLGIDEGAADRNRDYKSSMGNYVECKGNLIIRRVGDGFLAVQPSSRKVIIDKDCKMIFTVPRVPVLNTVRQVANRPIAPK